MTQYQHNPWSPVHNIPLSFAPTTVAGVACQTLAGCRLNLHWPNPTFSTFLLVKARCRQPRASHCHLYMANLARQWYSCPQHVYSVDSRCNFSPCSFGHVCYTRLKAQHISFISSCPVAYTDSFDLQLNVVRTETHLKVMCAVVAVMCWFCLEDAIQQGPEGEGTHPVCGPHLQEDQAILTA